MKMIATHNSATGERGKGILSFLVAPFSKCQSKTIREQYDAGCRYFDIRVKHVKGKWVCAHGLWTAKRGAEEILKEIDGFQHRCYVMLTYEGEETCSFMPFAGYIERKYDWLILSSVCVKKPHWRCLESCHNVPCDSEFKNLDGRSWHTYIPLPWLWKKIYYNHPQFNNQRFTMVDFL